MYALAIIVLSSLTLYHRDGSSVNETLVVPYLIYYDGSSFTNAQDYWTTNCYYPSPLDFVPQNETVPTATKKRHIVAKMPHKDKFHVKADLTGVPDSSHFGDSLSVGVEKLNVEAKDSHLKTQAQGSITVLVNSYVSVGCRGCFEF